MGLSFRKSISLFPGVRLSVSKSGPRISFGIPGARAGIDLLGNLRLFGGKGILRYGKSLKLSSKGTPNTTFIAREIRQRKIGRAHV